MSIFSNIRGVFSSLFGRQELSKPFGVTYDLSSEMYQALINWDALYRNSISNLASVIASEAARLATVDMKISVEGGERGAIIQSFIDKNLDKFQSKLELGCAYGSLIMKPNMYGIDFLPPTRFLPIEFDANGNIKSVIFIDTIFEDGVYYTRLEYHHEDDFGHYIIENKAFKSSSKLALGREIKLNEHKRWTGIEPVVYLDFLESPLFGYFHTPFANTIDIDSPLGVSIFARAYDSIADFDMWYTKWKREGKFSDKVLFVDEQAMMKAGASGKERAQVINPLPELVKGLKFGNQANKCIEEFNPEIRADDYKKALQTQLDIISVQCGFSSGYFSFDSRTGAVTATQINSEDQRTNSTCTAIQANYKKAILELVRAIDNFLYLYGDYPSSNLDINCYVKDLYTNFEEDRKRAFDLAEKKYIPKWKYLVDYEGYLEEDAKQLVSEANESVTSNEV